MRRARCRAVPVGVALALVAAAAAAQERPTVIVTDPRESAFRVAVQEFSALGPVFDAGRLRLDLVDALDFSGLFVPIDPAAFLEPVRSGSLERRAVPCDSWRQIGADALVEGGLTAPPPSPDPTRPVAVEVTTEFRVWDVPRCRQLLRKRYKGGAGSARRVARAIADDVVEAFTGTRGVAGTEVAFVSKRSGNPEVFVMDADGTNQRAVTNNRSINAFPDWAPDGQSIVHMSYRYQRMPHLFRIVRSGSARPGRLLRDLAPTTSVYRGVFDPSGDRLAVVLGREGASEIHRVDVDGRNLRALTRNGAIDVSPSWSPDGRQLAFVSDRAGSPQIYVMDADGKNARRLTFDGGYNTAPAWSPDGRWIAYEVRTQGQFDIWLIDPQGETNLPLVTHPRSDESPAWAPDGRKIAFQSARRGKFDIYVIDVDGTNLRRLTRGQGENTSPDWGPHLR